MAAEVGESARPLRIALVGTGALAIPPSGYGAVEEYIARLSVELGRLGHEVTILNRVPPFRSGRVRELVYAATLNAELAGGRFDLIHAQSALSAEALAVVGRPFVYTSHSRYWLAPVAGIERLWRARESLAVRRARGVIALTPRIVDRFRALRGAWPSDPRVAVIPFGVDVDRFRPPPSGAAREGVVGLGVVAPHKRFDILAAAARSAGVAARVIGPLPDQGLAEELRRDHPGLELVGELPLDELIARLCAARVFVHPSDMELASVATVQAMACGLPVVGSDLLEGIVTHGVNGYLVDRRAPTEERIARTAHFLRELFDDAAVCERMSAAARAAAVEEHAWPIVGQAVSRFYASVLSAGAPGATASASPHGA